MSESTVDKPTPPKIRHEWYQSDSEVTLSVFIKNVNKDNLRVDIAQRSVSLTIKHVADSEIAWEIEPLARSIDPENSSYRVMGTKIEFKLIKVASGVRWSNIEGDEEAGSSTTYGIASDTSRDGPSYPSSAKRKTDWNALANDLKKEEEAPSPNNDKDPNTGGDRELNKLFQKLYAGATDEQRMAMMKSYQESNGTALSTSWDEVKKGRVETKPPDSMIAKKWEQ